LGAKEFGRDTASTRQAANESAALFICDVRGIKKLKRFRHSESVPLGTAAAIYALTLNMFLPEKPMRVSLVHGRGPLQHALLGVVAAIWLGGCVATATVSAPAPAAYYGVEVDVAPPPPPAVEIPPPRAGFVWAPGYYNWNGHQHVWVEGRFIAGRPGYHWAPDHWEQHNGRYRFAKGHWER
jgi:hypothetical protein